MAVRLIVGHDENSFYAKPSGAAFGSKAHVLWSQESGGSRYTDVLYVDNSLSGSGTVNGTAYTGGVLVTGSVDGSFGAQLPDGLDVPGVWVEFDGRPARVFLRARQADGTEPSSAQAAATAAVAAEVTARQNADTAVQSAAATDATTKANAAQAAAVQRTNHTGTQPAGTITGLAAVATSGAKADVGLGNVDNTTDASKPVSTAQAAALGAVVKHGSTAGTSRPSGAVEVLWIGTVAPTNAATDDQWQDKSTTPATLKRWTGSAFEVIAGGGGGSSVSVTYDTTGQPVLVIG